jgi:sigma-B regulation protein RsbU (phosphoserine phosphatase)
MATGGHPPPLVLRAGGEVESFGPAGMILGATREPEIGSREIGLRSGDAVILYTDGITEARSTAGEFFGEGRLRELCEGGAELSAEELAEKIEATVRRFQQDNLQDDIASSC